MSLIVWIELWTSNGHTYAGFTGEKLLGMVMKVVGRQRLASM